MVTYGLPVVCMLNIKIRFGAEKVPKVILSEYLFKVYRYSEILKYIL
jgi:hypothetical protein